jgi:hypothetical protein
MILVERDFYAAGRPYGFDDSLAAGSSPRVVGKNPAGRQAPRGNAQVAVGLSYAAALDARDPAAEADYSAPDLMI